MVKKFHMRRLDLNNNKPLSAIFEFSILKGKIAKFRKIWIFKRNLNLCYSTVKKFRMRGLGLNTTFGNFSVFQFNVENHHISENMDFRT